MVRNNKGKPTEGSRMVAGININERGTVVDPDSPDLSETSARILEGTVSLVVCSFYVKLHTNEACKLYGRHARSLVCILL